MLREIQARLGDAVRTAARAAFDTELDTVTFQYPPRIELGDLALTAPFDLAKSLRRKPRDIALRLAEELAHAPGVRRAEVAGGGYVNLFLDRAASCLDLLDRLAHPRPAAPVAGHVVVEHTSINPNKAAHIGHLRNAALGDSFVRILRWLGCDVGVQNYIDDTGVQVADVVVGFLHIEGQGLSEVERIPGKFDYHCWDLYARVGDFYAADPGRRALQAEVLHAIEAGENATARLAAHVAARIVDAHLATMERLGIRYDLLAHESDVLRLHFWDRAFARLKQCGAIRLETEGKNAGCWVLSMGREEAGRDSLPTGRNDGEAPPRGRAAEGGHSDEDKIIVRSNGTVTYTGKDIAYQLWKLGLLDCDFRYRRLRTYPGGHTLWTSTSGPGEPDAPAFGHARRVYNVIDVGQSYPQRVVKAGVAAVGHREAAEGSHHFAYEKVVLSPATARALGYGVADDEAAVKVSGRKGLGVKADDLLDALVDKARAEIQAREPEREAEARERAARDIAIGALRYFLLKYGRTKVITFDMEEALAFVGETGPYVQNSVVRARNILAKLEVEGHAVAELLARARDLDLTSLLDGPEGDEVWSLMLMMARTASVAEAAVEAQEVSLLARHAFQVAQAFHGYYQKPAYSVLYAANQDLRCFRTAVVDAFVRQMEVLADLLGIPVPERM